LFVRGAVCGWKRTLRLRPLHGQTCNKITLVAAQQELLKRDIPWHNEPSSRAERPQSSWLIFRDQVLLTKGGLCLEYAATE